MSLLNLILERLEYEQLINEGVDPVEALHFKYKNVPEEVIDQVISIDPTKKKSYSQWLLSKWDNEQDTIVDNLGNGRIKNMFQYFKEHNEIQIKDCPSVEAGLRYVPEEDTVLVKSSAPTTTLMNGHGGWVEKVDSDLANDFVIVFNEDDWIIAVPNTYEADCKLGENTRWCTAGGRTDFEGGESYYNNYLDEGGQYYVNFDKRQSETLEGKEYPYKRYQFHFESKQFMDSNDDPVSLDEIDMPDSAIDFYDNEGYDRSDFEDLEAKMERYDGQRWQCAYLLREDELTLNIEYDDNYEFEEPDANTSYYLFDYNDDRDPISYESVPNPNFHNDVILENKENYIKLRLENSERFNFETFMLAHHEPDRNGWREWKAYIVADMIELGNNMIFAAAREKDYDSVFVYSLLTNRGRINYAHLKVDDAYGQMFVNEYCTNYDRDKGGRIFIETVNGEYHSLFSIGTNDESMETELVCVIKRDFPINGKYYAINENEQIRGEFQSYSIYNNGNNQEQTQYHLLKRLDNGDYVVSIDVDDEHDKYKEKINIVKDGDRRPLLDTWVTEIKDVVCDVYITRIEDWIPSYNEKGETTGAYRSDKYCFFGQDGHRIGDMYDEYVILDPNRGVFVGINNPRRNNKQIILVDPVNGEFAKFKEIESSKPFGNKIVVELLPNEEGGESESEFAVYDYIEKRFCYQGLGGIIRPRCRCNGNTMFCYSPNGGVNEQGERMLALLDVTSGKILLDNIIRKFQPFPFSTLHLLKLSNGKISAFDFEKDKFALPTLVDAVKKTDRFYEYIVYEVNNRYFIYFYDSGTFAINANGTDICPDTYEGEYIKYKDGNNDFEVQIVFKVNYDKVNFYGWSLSRDYDPEVNKYNAYSHTTSGYGLKEDTPQEIYNFYYRITGQNPSGGGQPQQSQTENPAYAVAEEFRRMMKRINEATKLKYNDILD